jgi:heparin/heparan-sulfate lyase
MGRQNFTYDEWVWHVKNDPRYDWSRVVAFEHAPDYSWTYVSGDATRAYSNPGRVSYSGRGDRIIANRPKIDLFTRSMVYVPETSNLIVFDRVNALDPSYRKAWLLHTIGKPQVRGKVVKAQVPGHIEDFDGDVVMATWPGGISRPADPNDPGRLFVRTFLPRKHTIRRIGGVGYECWSMGANRPPYAGREGKTKYLQGRDGQKIFADVYDEKRNRGYDLANWRLEVSPSQPSRFDNFLHLIQICDTKTRKMPPAEMVESEGRHMVGIAAGGWVVMFGRKGEIGGGASYTAPKGKTEHLVVDLKRGAKYKVSGIAGGERELAASKEGTLRFATDKAATVRLALVE